MSSDPPPEVIADRYEIQDPIGRGGMATIFRAVDLRMGRIVAVKILREMYSTDPKFVTRFQREARAASALQHPNIVQVFDYGQSKESYFIVMEYVDGMDLRRYLKKRSILENDRAVEIAHDVALGLGAAHRRGIVHRDVKPQNIMLNDDGLVKLTDFGIASMYKDAESERLTTTGMTLGTVQYYAPEQAQGEIVKPAADIYALGIVMYEMLTGRTPFEGDTPVAVAMKHIQEAPEPPSRYNPRVTPALERIILRCMEKDPRDRYRDGDTLAQALENYMRTAVRRTGVGGGTGLAAGGLNSGAGPSVRPGANGRPGAISGPGVPGPISAPGARSGLGAQVGPMARSGLLSGAAVASDPRVGAERDGWDGGHISGPPVLGRDDLHDDDPTVRDYDNDGPDWGGGFGEIGLPGPTSRMGGARPYAPPYPPYGPAGETARGPGVNGDGRRRGRGGVIALIAITALVLLGLSAGLIIALSGAFNNKPSNPQGNQVTVPDFSSTDSINCATAQTMASQDNVKVVCQTVKSNKPTGFIFKQIPTAGGLVKAGSTVTVYVSGGPGEVTVPNVIGLNEDDGAACAQITAAGLQCNVSATRINSPEPIGTVVQENPPGNSQQPAGTTITLTLSAGPEPTPTSPPVTPTPDITPSPTPTCTPPPSGTPPAC